MWASWLLQETNHKHQDKRLDLWHLAVHSQSLYYINSNHTIFIVIITTNIVEFKKNDYICCINY